MRDTQSGASSAAIKLHVLPHATLDSHDARFQSMCIAHAEIVAVFSAFATRAVREKTMTSTQEIKDTISRLFRARHPAIGAEDPAASQRMRAAQQAERDAAAAAEKELLSSQLAESQVIAAHVLNFDCIPVTRAITHPHVHT